MPGDTEEEDMPVHHTRMIRDMTQSRKISFEINNAGGWNIPVLMNICRTLVVHTHDIFLLLCVCTTRVIYMFTQADVLIVNHGHSYIDYVCAMCFWEHVEMFVIVSGAAIWVYATNYLTERAADGWNKRPTPEKLNDSKLFGQHFNNTD